MFGCRSICFTLSMVVACSGALSVTQAQTVIRDINQQKKHEQKAVIGLLGEFSQCASYEVAQGDLVLSQIIPRVGGLTSDSSGIIRVIRGGRVSQDLFYSSEMAFPLMHGDVLIALKSSSHVINESYEARSNQRQFPPKLTQVAIINLLDHPVIFGLHPEIADLAGILRCLRQPVEKYSQIARSVKVISSRRATKNFNFKQKKLTTKIPSGTVLVFNSKTGLDLSLIPKSLPVPQSLQTQLSSLPAAAVELNSPTPSRLEALPPQEVTPRVEATQRKLPEVTHPEDVSLPSKQLPSLKADAEQLQLNGPLLQQTTASLSQVPKPRLPQNSEGEAQSSSETNQDIDHLSAGSSVPDLNLKSAPLPPAESIQTLEDEELSQYDEFEESAESSSGLHWSLYFVLALIAALAWKYRHNKFRTHQVALRNHPRSQQRNDSESMKAKQAATVITSWDTLPPLPEKSLLEQMLENEIPVIEESPQIPTHTMIYGRHQSKSARIDQPETLKGPHFGKKPEGEPASAGNAGSTNYAPLNTRPAMAEKTLKAPAFRFDRSHPETTASDKAGLTDSVGSVRSSQSNINTDSGILDRVLQAVQGVIHK